ncbi:MAG TPA: hypothetical protein VG722_11100 [Tepidisphaeraceae bacterium]|nr:hypothetical protein [Tepidisphaeraceae bacterium]
MMLTGRELWTAIHGMVFGALLLMLFSGAFVAIWNLDVACLTELGIRRRLRVFKIASTLLALLAWLTVIAGTYVVYPWYRATPPAGTSGTAMMHYPRSQLLANPNTADWHELGMEWKEHIAWLTPILATCIAFIAVYCESGLVSDRSLRRMVLTLLGFCFVCAAIAGVFGAFINKAAPVR